MFEPGSIEFPKMNDIPAFDDALESFRRFLADQGHPTKIFWVFRDDIWKRTPTDIFLRCPSQTANLALTKKVFDEGRRRGLVDIHSIATVGDRVAATVWFPKYPSDEIQGWSRGMKLSVAEPLQRAKSVGQLRWLLFRLKAQFRHYQRFEQLIGTKQWAAETSFGDGAQP